MCRSFRSKCPRVYATYDIASSKGKLVSRSKGNRVARFPPFSQDSCAIAREQLLYRNVKPVYV